MDNLQVDQLWQTYMWVALVFLIFGLIFYFLPTFIAFKRGHQNRWAILIINSLLGVTVLGWIACLVWALSERPVQTITVTHEGVGMKDHFTKSAIEQLDQLAKLRSSGALNGDEFERLKAKVMSEPSEGLKPPGTRFGSQVAISSVGREMVSNGYALALAILPVLSVVALAVVGAGLISTAHYQLDPNQVALVFFVLFFVANVVLGLRDLAALEAENVETIPTSIFALFTLFYPLLGIYFWKRGAVIRDAYGDAVTFPRKHLLIWLISLGLCAALIVFFSVNNLGADTALTAKYLNTSGETSHEVRAINTTEKSADSLAMRAIKLGARDAVFGKNVTAFVWYSIAVEQGGGTALVRKELAGAVERMNADERVRAEDLLQQCKTSNYTKCSE